MAVIMVVLKVVALKVVVVMVAVVVMALIMSFRVLGSVNYPILVRFLDKKTNMTDRSTNGQTYGFTEGWRNPLLRGCSRGGP